MPIWLYALAGIALAVTIIVLEKFRPGTFMKLFGPKSLDDGRNVSRIGKAWCIFWIAIGALAIVIAVFGGVAILKRGDGVGALMMLPWAAFFALPVPYFFKALRTDLHTVHWDAEEISGPSDIRALGWKASRTTITTNDIKRQGHSFWFFYVESVDGRRIHWTQYHFARTFLELHIKAHAADQPKPNLFSRLLKF